MVSYREALTLEPSHAGARTALQAYLSSADPELQQAAVQELEPIYESTNDLADFIDYLVTDAQSDAAQPGVREIEQAQ